MPTEKDKIVFAHEESIDGKRYMKVRRRSAKGTVYEERQEVPESDRPILIIPGGGDIDDTAIRDMTQEAMGRGFPRRENKPDIAKLHQEYCENRGREISGRRFFGMWPRRKER
jgi:hypothetical protein